MHSKHPLSSLHSPILCTRPSPQTSIPPAPPLSTFAASLISLHRLCPPARPSLSRCTAYVHLRRHHYLVAPLFLSRLFFVVLFIIFFFSSSRSPIVDPGSNLDG
ncbi:unnamed protein product [Cuscuta epithymum]|uniref:Transmembrane protein n=1 Tax=Cuscuta epithymum TaxID=186058 RepID=A0AAV0CA92_9ASTE|nr:unnamed protein product [Cuscuta epithymum]